MTNKESVAQYQKKLKSIVIRVPSPEVAGVDYVSLMRSRAAQLGYYTGNGVAATGSIQAYILGLVSQDLGIEIKSISEL